MTEKEVVEEILRVMYSKFSTILSGEIEDYCEKCEVRYSLVLAILSPYIEIQDQHPGMQTSYKLNQHGFEFVASGCWSAIEEKRRIETIKLAYKENRESLYKIATILIAIAGIIVAISYNHTFFSGVLISIKLNLQI